MEFLKRLVYQQKGQEEEVQEQQQRRNVRDFERRPGRVEVLVHDPVQFLVPQPHLRPQPVLPGPGLRLGKRPHHELRDGGNQRWVPHAVGQTSPAARIADIHPRAIRNVRERDGAPLCPYEDLVRNADAVAAKRSLQNASEPAVLGCGHAEHAPPV